MCGGRLIVGSAAAMRAEPPQDTPHDIALETFWKAIEKGDDALLKMDNRGRTSASVSQLLIDQRIADADILFRACHEAANGRHAMASSLLCKFVECAGIEYADDNEGVWQ